MSKLGDMVRNAAIKEIERWDKKKVITKEHHVSIILLAECELNRMTADLSEVFTSEEQEKIDINEMQLVVCHVMTKMCEKLIELKKDKKKYKELAAENEAEVTELVKNLLGDKGIEALKAEFEKSLQKQTKQIGLPAIPGAPVFGNEKKDILN